MNEHLNKMRSCKWCELDTNDDMSAKYRCVHPPSLQEIRNTEYIGILCMNPDIVPCVYFEQ